MRTKIIVLLLVAAFSLVACGITENSHETNSDLTDDISTEQPSENSQNDSLLNKIQNVNTENEINNENINKYYYSLLDEYGKIIYDNLWNNIENLKTGIYKIEFNNTFDNLLKQENGTAVLENSFQLSLNAFISKPSRSAAA